MRRIHVLGAIALVIFTGPMLAAPAPQTSAEARQILPRTLVPSHAASSRTSAGPSAGINRVRWRRAGTAR